MSLLRHLEPFHRRTDRDGLHTVRQTVQPGGKKGMTAPEQKEPEYIITEGQLRELLRWYPVDVIGFEKGKVFRSRPYSEQAIQEQVLEELEKENNERMTELKSWIKTYQDKERRCNALAVLGERQYLSVKYAELRQQEREQG